MLKSKFVFSALTLIFSLSLYGQNVPILNYSINSFGQPQLEIEAQADSYYLLTARHEPDLEYESITSMTIGADGPLIISEPLAAFVEQNYKITQHSIADPDDTDGDGIDDITEYNERPQKSPLNFAAEVPYVDGTTAITSQEVFSDMAVVSSNIPWAPFLNNREFAKFVIVKQSSDTPEIYFINSQTHSIHQSFLSTLGLDVYTDDVETGEIVYNPNDVLPNGAIGSFLFNYSFGAAVSFETTRRTYELLAANMPFLKNNMMHFIGNVGENAFNNNFKDDYVGSRLDVVLESEFFADIDFIPFNQAEGFGFFKHMDLEDNPGSRDIVLYDALPNSLPRVGGIITSVVQTPLSHVNLRAIQDNVPNAFIRDPLMIDSIAALVGKYIYYKVDEDSYEIREASLDEVNEWYEKLRPTEPQIPERDLSQTEILPLDSIEFTMSTSFGAKCTNVATMRNFGFPEGTIPNGFGVPFYYYDEFMKFNNFYERVETMISDPEFLTDLEVRIDMLKDLRRDIKDADMPQWMMDNLQTMHESFPEGTSVRCRSSTNNEDLPGFSGAGLYTSKTQHPWEGHISKSIKQVYASMWNFRAYDERDFYRVDQYIAAMGVLCHPNYEDEQSNGVGVSLDPIYQTEGNFYINTQVGEDLITNPEANSIPEEILLNQDPNLGYFVLRESNLVPVGQLVMTDEHINELRSYLQVIHDEFEILYNVVGAEGFGMDIEYKVTVDDQLIIKQARPWVSFWAEINATFDLSVEEIVHPQSSSSLGDNELVRTTVVNRGLRDISDFELSLLVEDELVETIQINEVLNPQSSNDYEFTMPQDFSTLGEHNIAVVVAHPEDGYSRNDTLAEIVHKLHPLEGAITSVQGRAKCGSEVEVIAKVLNLGEFTFSNTELEVTVNGQLVETLNYDFGIPYLAEVPIVITVKDNLEQIGNEISVKLVKVNGEEDAVADNNEKEFSIDLNPDFQYITFVVNVDNYPSENAWEIFETSTNEIIESGDFLEGSFSKDICVDYTKCYTLIVTDTYGDGICCGFGLGNFHVLNSAGDRIVDNDGDFGSIATESFCPDESGCALFAEIVTQAATSPSASDGVIAIIAAQGLEPYQYSIDGGQAFSNFNIFSGLPADTYEVVVVDATGTCTYEETVLLESDIVDSVDDLNANSIVVKPNPTQDVVSVHIENLIGIVGNVEVAVFNGIGQLIDKKIIQTTSGENITNVNLSTLVMQCILLTCK